MEDVVMTFAFLLLAIFLVFIRFVIPIILVVIGLFRTRHNKRFGNLILIIGIIYLLISLFYFIFSMIKYGF